MDKKDLFYIFYLTVALGILVKGYIESPMWFQEFVLGVLMFLALLEHNKKKRREKRKKESRKK